MRGLMAAVIGMGIMIVAGVTVLVVVMVQRMSASPPSIASAGNSPSGPPANILIDEPAGTRVGTLSLAGDHLALALSGGGPDRVVVVDTRTGRIIARTALAR